MADHRHAVRRRRRAADAHSGAIHGSASLTLIGPPIMPMPANARGSSGTGSPASSATSCHGRPLRVEPLGEMRRALRSAKSGRSRRDASAGDEAPMDGCASATKAAPLQWRLHSSKRRSMRTDSTSALACRSRCRARRCRCRRRRTTSSRPTRTSRSRGFRRFPRRSPRRSRPTPSSGRAHSRRWHPVEARAHRRDARRQHDAALRRATPARRAGAAHRLRRAGALRRVVAGKAPDTLVFARDTGGNEQAAALPARRRARRSRCC